MKKTYKLFLLNTLATLMLANNATAQTLPLVPADTRMIGALKGEMVYGGETLIAVSRRGGVGYQEIRLANPEVDFWLPEPGKPVMLPSQYILPDAPREGLVVNVAELRVYYYHSDADGQATEVTTFPVSVGRQDWRTPLGRTEVAAKIANPAWYPPASIKREHAERGTPLPDVVPPGPDNPLGAYKLPLKRKGYLLHGTNRPQGIGMRVTHGCLRFYPEDIAWLYRELAVGTSVHIVNQPYKFAWQGDILYLEAHPPLEELADPSDDQRLLFTALETALAENPRWEVDRASLDAVVALARGWPEELRLRRKPEPADQPPAASEK